ncbi:MAG: hypothetical protein ACE14M_12835 [Terriglobales bacterium]
MFVLTVALPTSVLIAQTIRIVLAEMWGASPETSKIQRAIWLDPANPELHYSLGGNYLLGTERAGLEESVEEFRKATKLNPHSSVYWSGLAMACYAAGEQSCAGEAFHKAAELAPSNPYRVWEAAVNDVISGRRREAVAQLKRYVELQPDRASTAFELLLRHFEEYDVIRNDLLGATANINARLAYLDFLAAGKRFDLAGSYWAEMVAARSGVPFAGVKPYLERLIACGHYAEAAQLWSYLEKTGVVANVPHLDENLVFNGNFEREPLDAGFDWRYQQQRFLNLDFSSQPAHSGARALRVDFTSPQNLEYEPVIQLVPMAPNESYLLTAYVKSDGITSDSGPRFRVSDPQCPACLNTATEGVTGTTSWHQVALRFTTGPETEVVRISIWRPRSRSFPMEISGTAWFDDVSLRPVQPGSEQQFPNKHSLKIER